MRTIPPEDAVIADTLDRMVQLVLAHPNRTQVWVFGSLPVAVYSSSDLVSCTKKRFAEDSGER